MVNPESQIYSQNNYPPQNGGSIIPTQAVYNDKYRNYQNITQINHKRIYQPDENTFYISTGCFAKLFPAIFIILGIFLLIFPINGLKETGVSIYIIPIIGLIFFIVGLCLNSIIYNKIYFIMGPNTLTIMKKALCRKKTQIYNLDELLRIELNYVYSRKCGRSESLFHK